MMLLGKIIFLCFVFLSSSLAYAQDSENKTIFDAITENDISLFHEIMSQKNFKLSVKNEQGQTPFIYAIQYSKNPGILKPLLEKEGNLNVSVSKDKNKPLMPLFLMLRRYADADLIDMALKKGADATIVDENGEGTLIYAYRYFRVVPVLKMLIDAGANIYQKDTKKQTVFHMAIKDGETGIVKLFLDSGFSPDSPDSKGILPLELVLKYEEPEILDLLIKYQAEIYPEKFEDKTLLMKALQKAKNPKTIEVLLKASFDVQDKDLNGMTPLMYAAQYATNPEFFHLLLEKGAYPKTKDDQGLDAFDYLQKNNLLDRNSEDFKKITAMLHSNNYYPDFFELLKYGTVAEVNKAIEEGADVNEPDYNNLYPILLAAQHSKDIDILRTLLKHGADPQVKDENGRQALIYAIDAENIPMIKELINAKVDLNASDMNGDTALIYLAQHTSNPEILSLLLEAKADVNKSNTAGRTPLMTAAEFTENPKIIHLLLEKGAKTDIRDSLGKKAEDYAKENIRLRHKKRYKDLMQRLSR